MRINWEIRLTIFFLFSLFGGLVNAQTDSLTEESSGFDDLLSLEVQSASGISESYLSAPATMVVISEKEIKQRGYLSLDQVLKDVPGFDISVVNGTIYMNAYQRGYRTPFTQRTLLMVNGKKDNHLWTHMANISRQYPIQNIKQVEILYGPASAVYGPNAFLGVINIITKKGKDLEKDGVVANSSVQYGSNNTNSADVFVAGKQNKIAFNFGAKIFRSDEEDLSSKYGFASNELYSDTNRWGPLLDLSYEGEQFGSYKDPTDNWGMNGEITFGDFTFGAISWVRKEAYGAYYAADKAQNSTQWNYSSNQFFADYNKDVNDNLTINTTLLRRYNRVWGGWAEATHAWDDVIHTLPGDTLTLADRGLNPANFADYSFISLTNWHSSSNSWLFKQNADYTLNEKFSFQGGIKYERKELTKAYDMNGYWDAFSSSTTGTGPHGWGAAVGHSSDPTYALQPPPVDQMPATNLIYTTDIGGFVQSIIDLKAVKLQTGVRYDHNSIYGKSINPRVAAIYKLPKENGAIKLLYGEAFQEPAPIQLFGGWNGRAANPNLLPEKTRNMELVVMYNTNKVFQQLSVYNGVFENVIKEQATNAGNRNVFGVEYALRSEVHNPISETPINVFAYYTFTRAISSTHYDFTIGDWVDGDAEVGDIAPHKVNVGVNVPVKDWMSINLRGQYVSERTPYLRNQLRSDINYKIPAYFNLDGTVNVFIKNATLGVRVNNVTNAAYFHPGPEGASAGNDFDNASLGFQNSLVPTESINYIGFLNFQF